MEIDYGRWENSFTLEEKKRIVREIVQALGCHSTSVTCKVSRDPSGSGIVIQMQGTTHPAPLMLALDDEWQKQGVIERMVREVSR